MSSFTGHMDQTCQKYQSVNRWYVKITHYTTHTSTCSFHLQTPRHQDTDANGYFLTYSDVFLSSAQMLLFFMRVHLHMHMCIQPSPCTLCVRGVLFLGRVCPQLSFYQTYSTSNKFKCRTLEHCRTE